MLNLVGEIFQSTKRYSFFRRINNISVTLSIMRNDNLGMALGSESSTFKKWLFMPDTLLIYVLSGFNIINSINYKVKSCPEIIVKILLAVISNSHLYRLETRMMVNSSAYFTSYLTFVFADVLLPEQKLSIEVTDLYVIIICTDDISIASCTYSHQSKHLNKFTP